MCPIRLHSHQAMKRLNYILSCLEKSMQLRSELEPYLWILRLSILVLQFDRIQVIHYYCSTFWGFNCQVNAKFYLQTKKGKLRCF